ncbi:MAG: homoserine dehydrogenase [Ruminococcaceae bacterium]|nr:homoserine dehydrogenase [Oscillospiraceae bacterium]
MISMAILGFGVVGSGCAEVLTQNKDLICESCGSEIEIKYILDLRDFPDSPFADRVVHDFQVILNDPEVSLVAEMMGGSHPAYEFTKACLCAGKSVVTSNKEVVSNFGTELLQLAEQNGVSYLFEASVGGGIPVLRSIYVDLASNRIRSVNGILNGTTNYILSSMKEHGTSFDDALAQAQKLGYAEANPAADVQGLDAARKVAILCGLCFGKLVCPASIPTTGITGISGKDVEDAAKLGYAIKLIGHADVKDGKITALVSPRMVPLSNPLSGVSDVFNGVLVNGNMVGDVMFYGPGAGKLPTASAVVADIIDIVSGKGGAVKKPHFVDAVPEDLADFSSYACVRYFRVSNSLSEVSAVFGTDALHLLTGDGYVSVITAAPMSEREADEICEKLDVLSTMRVL